MAAYIGWLRAIATGMRGALQDLKAWLRIRANRIRLEGFLMPWLAGLVTGASYVLLTMGGWIWIVLFLPALISSYLAFVACRIVAEWFFLKGRHYEKEQRLQRELDEKADTYPGPGPIRRARKPTA